MVGCGCRWAGLLHLHLLIALALALALPSISLSFLYTSSSMSSSQNFFSFSVLNKFRKPEELKQFAGNVVLAVNVASQCGFTKQYAGLEQLYRKYKDQGFTVIGFPSNEFGGQEPGSEAEIEQFCKAKFDVSFPLMAN